MKFPAGIPNCLCGLEGPDEFGNYDLLEHPDCPIHGASSEHPGDSEQPSYPARADQ